MPVFVGLMRIEYDCTSIIFAFGCEKKLSGEKLLIMKTRFFGLLKLVETFLICDIINELEPFHRRNFQVPAGILQIRMVVI